MTRKKSSLILFPSCHDFKSIRVLPDFPNKHKIQSSRIYLITRLLCFETRYSCAWANDRGLWERDCLGPSHNSRKAVNTLKLINNWSHLFEECGLCAILLGIQDNWTFFDSDWILARFHLGKLLLMFKIYLLWKIWPYKKGETCVDTPFPQKVLWEKAMETGVDSRLCFIILASFFPKARMKVHEHNICLPFQGNNRRNRPTELSCGYMYQSERIT